MVADKTKLMNKYNGNQSKGTVRVGTVDTAGS